MKQANAKSISRIMAAAAMLLAAGCSEDRPTVAINGAGASFPAPVYQNWTHAYSQGNPGIRINYQSLGSGAGLNQIKAGTIDFAGSDNPLTLEEQQAAGLRQFPMLTGGVVVIVNLPEVENLALKLDRAALADIFLGNITRWNDPRLRSLNPELKLPDLAITVVRRADASGTSFIFTDYLAKISPEWERRVGRGASVDWPVGIGGQKNPGVCNNVARIKGAIGYTEYTYAAEAKLAMAQLENRAGKFVKPTMASFSAGVAAADWENAPGFHMILTDQPGETTWPITGVTYILFRNDCDAKTKANLFKYFNWCFTTGATAARKLNYVPIPEKVVTIIQNEVFK